MSAFTNGSVKANRAHWHTMLRVEGWGDAEFERSPVLGTGNVRVRPRNPRAAVLAYCTLHPDVLAEFARKHDLGLTPEEQAHPAMIEAFAEDLFPLVCARLDGVAGRAGASDHNRPSLAGGFSFRTPVATQRDIRARAGGHSVNGPVGSAADADDLRKKLEAQRARLAAANNPPTTGEGGPPANGLAGDPAPDAGGDGMKRRGTKK
jgi:hypothetical protein